MYHLNKYTPALLLIVTGGFIASPVLAQSTVTTSASYAAQPQASTKYEGVYVVIKANTSKETLLGIEEKLKKVGIDFKLSDLTAKDGLITGLTIAVDVPGVYSGTVSSNHNQGSLNDVYFYSEGTQAGLSNGNIPPGISARGQLVVTNNLNGLAILYNNDSVEFSGSFTTKWKSR
jgi:hypothetical protein